MLDALSQREAKVRYLQGAFQLQTPGDYVVCAVTAKRIPLGELRYWSVGAQEAYFDAEAATTRYEQMTARDA
jgi:hypothetical protein